MGTGFALGVISTAHLPPCLHVAGLHSFQVFLPVLLVTCGLGTVSTSGGAVTQFLGWACANPALGPAKLLIRGFESSRSAPHQISWSKCAVDLVLQTSQTAGWYYSLGATGMNLICQDLCACCCKTLPNFSSRSDSQWLIPVDSPAMSPEQAQSGGSHKTTHDAGVEVLLFPWVLFPIAGARGSGETYLHTAALAWGRGNGVNV